MDGRRQIYLSKIKKLDWIFFILARRTTIIPREQKLSFAFPTRAVQSQKRARGLKFQI